MTRRLALLLALCAVPIALVVSACGSDDGAEVRRSTGESASPSNPDSASAPGSASGSGLSLEETQTAGSGNALVSQGVVAYSDYVADQVDEHHRHDPRLHERGAGGEPAGRRAPPTPPAARAGSASSRSPA